MSILRCAAQLKRGAALRLGASGEVDYGIIVCQSCEFEYPIIAGIPILMAAHETLDSKFETTEITRLEGPRIADLLALLKHGDERSALAAVLNPSKPDGNWFPSHRG